MHRRQDIKTIAAANNYAVSLNDLRLVEETKLLLRKMIRVARRVLGETDSLTLKMRWTYGQALYEDGATLDDLREAVTTLEDVGRIARRVLGGAHPFTESINDFLPGVRAALLLRAREETPSGGA